MNYHGTPPATGERPKDRTQVAMRLIARLRPYWKAVATAFILIAINAGTQAVGPYLVGRAIDQYIQQADSRGLAGNMLILAGVYLIGMLSMRYQIFWMSWAGQKVLADLRMGIIQKVEQLSLQRLEAGEAGDLMSRLVNDIDVINAFLGQGLTQALGALFALTGIIIAILALDWRLALAVMSVIPVMALTTGQFARLARTAFRRTRTTIGDVSAGLNEELGGVRVAQAFNRGELNAQRFAERNAANRDANVSANTVTAAFAPAMDVLSTLDTAIVAGYGGYLAIQGSVSVGIVVAFLQYVQNFFRPIQTVAQIWTTAQSAMAAAERVFDLLEAEIGVEDLPGAIPLPQGSGKVAFEQVSFHYDANKPVLREINLSAVPGETIAIVGPTGAGKTTLASLILRFYDVDSGTVRVDGYDVRSVTQKSLRSVMGLVTQEPFLFSGTVMDNIRYGRLEATDDEVVEAARAAQADGFIRKMPQGYDTPVGERGGTLSQGQRQLIAIARAVLADPRILILDEATASVDTRTEVAIQRALERLMQGRTSFVIAHRLATVRNADQVLVIDQGRIVERGTHQSLLNQQGMYADLYRRQFVDPQGRPEAAAAVAAAG